MKKWILTLSIFIVVAIAGAGYYFYNKGEVNIEKAKSIKVSSSELYEIFSKDSVAARSKFSDKILEVEGIVNAVSKNQQNQTVIQIKTLIEGAYVNCTTEAVNDLGSVKTGDAIVLKGVCKGIGEGDKEMGILGDVYLIRCHKVN